MNIATSLESNSYINYVITNINNNTSSLTSVQVSLIDSLITDHYPVITQLIDYNSNTNSNNINTETIIFNRINYNKLNDLIKHTKCSYIMTDSNNANFNINVFTKTSLKNILKQSTVTSLHKPKKITIRGYNQV